MIFEIENYNANYLMTQLIELDLEIDSFDHVDNGIDINCIEITDDIQTQIQTVINNHNPDEYEEQKSIQEQQQEIIDYLLVKSLEG